VRCLWLIPITRAERDYKKENGLEALAELFERSGFAFMDPLRFSVVD
jgi:suppressor of fused protein SUFU